uniref:Uncharacterized protein n=1 Tax=Strongyloides papillosus TaxID=174720 RepID=A0A0N5BK48_STREA
MPFRLPTGSHRQANFHHLLRLAHFKDPEEQFREAKMKIEKVRLFQKYPYENNMKVMYMQFHRAVNVASENMQQEFKKRELQHLCVVKKKKAMIKDKEDEINNLKSLLSRYRQCGRALNENIKELESYSQQSKESLLLCQAKLNSTNLKRPRDCNNKINYQKPGFDASQASFNLQKRRKPQTVRRSKSSDLISFERPNTRDSKSKNYLERSIPIFKFSKSSFKFKDSNASESYGGSCAATMVEDVGGTTGLSLCTLILQQCLTDVECNAADVTLSICKLYSFTCVADTTTMTPTTIDGTTTITIKSSATTAST